ncbi:snRNA-activating protein complex subunit 3-like [Branchiostoma floridae]|uniref:snRNA-activating protein complex subunit 3 n=2 Tax=Branchiostoma floridae TaxID=7739 RepID=A0A9J7KNG3_BRAFL|nr:snRNA-activating protein complex subunit 3-like [Branchiostoma floridae]
MNNIMEPASTETFSPQIHVQGFVDEAIKTLDVSDLYSKRETLRSVAYAEAMNVPIETVDELKSVCSMQTLKCPSEDIHKDAAEVPTGTELVTLGLRKRYLDSKPNINKNCKFTVLSWNQEHVYQDVKPPPEREVKPQCAVLQVAVFHPSKRNRRKSKGKRMRLAQEYRVLGYQKLTDLRDAITCIADHTIAGEFSERPCNVPDIRAKDIYKSAYFFIENVFYNDFRYEDNRDLSRNVREWEQNKHEGKGSYTTQHMEDVKFNDLHIRLGYPYLYCHQGDCEHLIIFKDLRMFHADDCRDEGLYPLMVNRYRFRRQMCRVCATFTAKWVTYDDQLAEESPCFFCDLCFKALHYSKDQTKLAEFEAYPYVDMGIFNLAIV